MTSDASMEEEEEWYHHSTLNWTNEVEKKFPLEWCGELEDFSKDEMEVCLKCEDISDAKEISLELEEISEGELVDDGLEDMSEDCLLR